jgi:two-component system sensor histidine kinase KdpD
MAAGVGKTYAMLKAAHQRKQEGRDIVIGIVETHGRSETAVQLEGLETLPRRKVSYRGTELEDLDLDLVLSRKPDIVVVDELAHTNVPGLRHAKRYQDVLELLDAGINVYTALNVQHLESRKDAVEGITQVSIRETVPDSILERATQIELVDIAPNELLTRLQEGKVYLGDKAQQAAQNFFREDKLTALREIALRITAERVDQDLQRFVGARGDRGPWQTNERLMVAISHSPYSEKLIRAARRISYNLEAPWVAVYVDVGLSLNNADQAQLAKNLSLARELKAEVVATVDSDVATALRRIAHQKNVTQILVGRPGRRFLRDVVEGGTLLDRLVRESREFDVHVIRQEGAPAYRPFWQGMGGVRFHSGPSKYWRAFWFLACVAGACGLVEPYIGYRAVGFVFLLAVMAIGMVGTVGPVAFSAVVSAFAWNYFFIPPRFTFNLQSADDIILCLSFLVVALIMGSLTARIRFHERLNREREERTNVLYEIVQDIAHSREKGEFLGKTLARVGQILNAECAVFLADQFGVLQFDFTKPYSMPLNEKAQAVAAWAMQSQLPAGWSTDTLSEAKSLYVPLKGPFAVVGVFVFKPKTGRRLGLEQENLLYSVVRQLSLALERHFAEKRLQEAHRLEESEKLHQALLSSISHEMRTPLTSLMGAASALADEASTGDPQFVRKIAGQLLDAGDRLNRVIENLLDMTRLNSGALELKSEWHDVRDLVGVVLKKLEKNLVGRPVRALIPDGMPMVKMDFRLMEHALSNLVLNAAMYSPAGAEIRIIAETSAANAKISVEDDGDGIPPLARAQIFEKFYRLPGTPSGGLGLGLSIAKSIVEAHGGQISVDSSASGGACFAITMPTSERPPSVPEAS